MIRYLTIRKNPVLPCFFPFECLYHILALLALLILTDPAAAMPGSIPPAAFFSCEKDDCNITGIEFRPLIDLLHFSMETPYRWKQESGAQPVESPREFPFKTYLLNMRIRYALSSFDVLGAEAPEKFQAWDIAVTFRLPWGWYSQSDWGVGIRPMTCIGALTGSEDTGLVVSFIPLLSFGSRDERFTLDMGAGAALFGRTTFGTQDFGGNFQFALTAGLGIPVFKRLGAGYRFMHYSDSRIYGSHTIGADMHMLEVAYRFY